MTCFFAKRFSTSYIDGGLRSSERSRVETHLRECDSCASYFQQITSLRSGLRRIGTPSVPDQLSLKLKVLASKERAAVLETRGSRLLRIWNRWKFRLDEFMRPLTIPATGGLLSSFLLFATLALSISQNASSVGYEVPVTYQERADATLVPVDMRSAVVLTMRLDSVGHIMDYAVRDGSFSYVGDPGRIAYNNISLPAFPTVLRDEHPIIGDIRISVNPIIFRQ